MRPARTSRRVDFPAPLGPIMPITEPGADCPDTSSKILRVVVLSIVTCTHAA